MDDPFDTKAATREWFPPQYVEILRIRTLPRSLWRLLAGIGILVAGLLLWIALELDAVRVWTRSSAQTLAQKWGGNGDREDHVGGK